MESASKEKYAVLYSLGSYGQWEKKVRSSTASQLQLKNSGDASIFWSDPSTTISMSNKYAPCKENGLNMLIMKYMHFWALILHHHKPSQTNNLGEQQPRVSKTDTKFHSVDFISQLSAFENRPLTENIAQLNIAIKTFY